MATTPNPNRPGRVDDLNDSWVELHYQSGPGSPETQRNIETDLLDSSSSSTDPTVQFTGSMEKLLIDAQRESRTPSRPNSNESSTRGSPKSPSTPNSEWSNDEWRQKQDVGTDWIWDWSSRPELQQSFDTLSEKCRHPPGKPNRAHLSVRNTQVMKKTRLFSLANLPTLLLTHACSFFLGAAAVLIYMRKYWNFPALPASPLDSRL